MRRPRLERVAVSLLWLWLRLHAALPVHVEEVEVATPSGRLAGRRLRHDYDLRDGGVTDVVDQFLGVPYAQPPVGELRFQEPAPVERWSGVRDATRHGHICPQIAFYPETAETFQHEDCLSLNIYSPHEPGRKEARYPVMVYIHGGSYEVGSGKLYDGTVLAMNGVVVVTINYRLGALGFLTTGSDVMRGNFGLLDQVEALRWVRAHIAAFRGDAARVTIFGHSAGGASVGLLLTVPSAAGLFHGVIAQSGSALASYSFHQSPLVNFTNYVLQVGELFRCGAAPLRDVVRCLRRVPFIDFITKRQQFPLFDPIDPEFRPIIDRATLPAEPRSLLARGRFTKVPVIVGTVKNEFGNYFNGGARHKPAFDRALDRLVRKFTGYNQALADVVRYEYTDWRKVQRLHGDDTYYDRGGLLSDMHMVAPTVDLAVALSNHSDVRVHQYHFTAHDSYHSVELNYVFGAPFSGVFADEMSGGHGKNFSERDRAHSRFMMRLWTNFAKFRHPTPPENSVRGRSGASSRDGHDMFWEEFRHRNKSYLHLSPHGSRMKQHLRAEKVAFWNVLIPRLKTDSKYRPVYDSYKKDYVAKMWAFLGISAVLLLGIVILLVLLIRAKMREVDAQRTLWADPGAERANGHGPTIV